MSVQDLERAARLYHVQGRIGICVLVDDLIALLDQRAEIAGIVRLTRRALIQHDLELISSHLTCIEQLAGEAAPYPAPDCQAINGYRCPACGQIEGQGHLIHCPARARNAT